MEYRIVLIRHGKTRANIEQRYLGRTEQALIKLGREELIARKESCPNVDYLYASPMLRCRETCEILYPNHSYNVKSEFREMDFGDFEMKNYQELEGNLDYQRWIDSNGTLPFPGGESRESFIKRQLIGFVSMLREVERKRKNSSSQEKKTIGIVTHGGSIMALLSGLGQGDYFEFQCKNGDGYQFDIEWEEQSDLLKNIHITNIMKISELKQ